MRQKTIPEVCALLETDPDRGLTEKEAARRREIFGGERAEGGKRKRAPWKGFLEQLNESVDLCF